MKRLVSVAVVLFFSLFLTACGLFSGEDNSIPPTELEDINATAKVATQWSKNIGVGVEEVMLNLKPAIVDYDIYSVDREGQVTDLDLETGNIKWQVELDTEISGGVGAGQGIVVVGNSSGEIIVLDMENGSELWRKQLSSVMLSAPLIQDQFLVVRTGDGRLYGLDTENGAQLWIYDRGVPVLTLRGNSSPIVGGRELVFTGFDSGKVTAVGIKHGRLLWESNAAVARGRSDLERLVDIDANMILIGRALYAVTYQGQIVAIDALEGDILWSKEMSSYAGIAADDRHIYVTDSDSNIWAVDRVTGDFLWKQDKLAYRKVTAPITLGEYVVVGDFEGYIHILSREDGELIGREKIDSDGFHVQPLEDAGTLYFYGNGGDLTALRIN